MADVVSTPSAEQRAAIIDEVTAAMHAYEAAVKRLDAGATVAFYVDSQNFRF